MKNHLFKETIAIIALFLCFCPRVLAVESSATKSDGTATKGDLRKPASTDLVILQSIHDRQKLEAVIRKDVFVSPADMVTELTEEAIKKDSLTTAIQKRERKHHGGVRKLVASLSDISEFLLGYKGFEGSSEAADIILDEKLKLKSKDAVEYARQKQFDETHQKIVAALIQIAMGLGLNDESHGSSAVSTGIMQLESLVGEEEAITVLHKFTRWAKAVRQSSQVSFSPPWDVFKMQSNTEKIVDNALQNDPVIAEIRDTLHRYNHRSKFMRASGKIVQTSLSIAMFSPTIVSPAAQIALLGFVAITGGPEEAKLLTELYLDRRFESRWRRTNKEASLALNNYEIAHLTNNAVLANFCENFIISMTQKASLKELFDVHSPTNNVPSSVASTERKTSF